MKEKLARYIKENLILPSERLGTGARCKSVIFNDETMLSLESVNNNIINYIDDNKNENKFQTLLFKYIDERNLKDSDVYNKVHIDRRLFAKIRSNANYHPSKETIILLALALKLSLEEFMALLESASYGLPKNNYFDLIIRFCFINGIYDIKDVNELLVLYNCKLFNY